MVQQRRSNLFQLTGGLGCKFKFVINNKDSTNPLFGHIRAPRIRTPEEKGATKTSLCGERHPLSFELHSQGRQFAVEPCRRRLAHLYMQNAGWHYSQPDRDFRSDTRTGYHRENERRGSIQVIAIFFWFDDSRGSPHVARVVDAIQQVSYSVGSISNPCAGKKTKHAMKRLIIFVFSCVALLGASCSRFHNAPTQSKDARYVVISPIYNEIIWALGAQNTVVGIDLSTTYPPEVKNVQTVGYHRALSAEGILSLHPTAIIHDNNIGPPQVVQQLEQLNIPMKQ